MKALISGYHKSTTCTWCEKTTEAVEVEFDRGFLQKSKLCFRCLQQAIRVHHKQQLPAHTAKTADVAADNDRQVTANDKQ